MATSELELAREAKAELDRKQNLADKLPQLERQEARRVEISNAEVEEAMALEVLNNAIPDYKRLKRERDKLLTDILKLMPKVITAGGKFDAFCDGDKDNPYHSKSFDDYIGDVAIAQLVQTRPRNQIDNLAITERKIDIARDMGIYPLCHYGGDRSGVKQEVLNLLAKYIALNW